MEDRHHASSFSSLSTLLPTQTWQGHAQRGAQDSLASGRFGELLGQHVFPVTEKLPTFLICCGPAKALGITATTHTVSFQSLGWIASMSFLDFSVPWYHCCQGCTAASSVAPGPPLSFGCLPGDKGRTSYPSHSTLVSQPLSLPRPKRGVGHRNPMSEKLYGRAWSFSSLPPANFLIIFL